MGGALELWAGAAALGGSTQLSAGSGDGMGKLLADYPVIALVLGPVLLLAGIAVILIAWFPNLDEPKAPE